MKIAVIGAGIFGVTSAIKLAEAGFEVDLFEKNRDIMQGASGINQFRLHKGYHYPRSKETIESSINSDLSFKKEYGESVITGLKHFYHIAKEKSFVSGEEYLKILDKNGLKYKISENEAVRKEATDLCIEAEESLMDPIKLKKICGKKLKSAKVNLFLNTTATLSMVKKYDYVIVCTYAWQNSFLNKNYEQKDYQFEVCEKIVVKMPPIFSGKSIVIMDGPFMCADPYSSTDLHLLGNVVYAIHSSNIGKIPIVPDEIKPLLDKGIIKNPPITNFKKFIKSASYFMPEITKAKQIGSMYTIRTVLPYKEDTDTRPTIVERLDDRTISIFSGKFSNCVEAAEEVLRMVS